MGGYGSTRWGSTATRDTVESARRLDVATLRAVPNGDGPRLDVLREPGALAVLRWGEGDEELRLRVEPGEDGRAARITSSYRSRYGGGPWRDRTMSVRVVWRPCNLGGAAPLFVCPACRRERRAIYVHGPTACRECLGLAYTSTRESEAERAERRARRIRRRLDPTGEHDPGRGWGFAHAAPLPPRPHGMPHATYARLARRYRHALDVAHAHRMAELVGIVARLDREPFGSSSAADWRAEARALADMPPAI